jgi:hypothetical protein
MSVSFHIAHRRLTPLVAMFACTAMTGCLAFGHHSPKVPEPTRNEQEQRHGSFGRFSGTWQNGAYSQLTIAADGAVSGTLARPATGSFFDGRGTGGVVQLGSLAGATPVRLAPGHGCQCVVVLQVPSTGGLGSAPPENLTLSFCVNRHGDQLRVRARSDRREETYILTRS